MELGLIPENTFSPLHCHRKSFESLAQRDGVPSHSTLIVSVMMFLLLLIFIEIEM